MPASWQPLRDLPPPAMPDDPLGPVDPDNLRKALAFAPLIRWPESGLRIDQVEPDPHAVMPGVVEGDSASSAAAAQRAKGLWFGYQLSSRRALPMADSTESSEDRLSR